MFAFHFYIPCLFTNRSLKPSSALTGRKTIRFRRGRGVRGVSGKTQQNSEVGPANIFIVFFPLAEKILWLHDVFAWRS